MSVWVANSRSQSVSIPVDSTNSSTTPLGGGATFTGQWSDLSKHNSVTVDCTADVAGTLYFDQSDDGSTVQRTLQLSDGASGDMGRHVIAPTYRYGRVRLVNGASAQGTLSLETIRRPGHKVVTTKGRQSADDYTDAALVRLISEPMLDEARGLNADRGQIQKFGANLAIAANTEEDIWSVSALYTWLSAASTIQVRAGGSVNDDNTGGSHARKVKVQGLDSNWDLTTEELTLAGASASAASTTQFIRVFRAWVTEAGTYGNSNDADIDIEDTTGSNLIARIAKPANTRGEGQTQMCIYTVPDGYEAYVRRVHTSVGGANAADVRYWQRQNADTTSAPTSSPRVFHSEIALTGVSPRKMAAYPGPFPARTDLWASCTAGAGGAEASAGMDIVLVATP